MRCPRFTLITACAIAHATAALATTANPIFINGFGAEPSALAGITADHNVVRNSVGVGLAPLFWDERLAASAQAWANQCVDSGNGLLIAHNPNRSVGFPWYVGENIYGSSGTATASGAVNLWASEQQYYHYATNSCDSGQICGHYTQIVWSTSVLLGCGISYCPSLTLSHSIVCDYGPGGNYVGVPPY
jgi:pathogenesis-related protein 1